MHTNQLSDLLKRKVPIQKIWGLRPAFLTVSRCPSCHCHLTLSNKSVEEGTPSKSQRLAAGPARANPGDETIARKHLTFLGLRILAYNVELNSPLHPQPKMLLVTKT